MVGRCKGAIHIIVINGVSFIDGIFILIIGPFGQGSTAHPALVSVGFDGINEDIVGMIVVFFTQSTAHDTILGNLSVQEHFNNIVQLYASLFKGCVQFFGLNLISWKPVQEPSVFAVILFQAVKHHGDGDVIGNQISLVNEGFGLFAKLGAALDVFPEDGPRFNVGEIVFVLEDRALGTFATAVGSEKNDVHGMLLLD